MTRSISRRVFLGTSAALIGLSCKSRRTPAGTFVDDGGARGHRLRTRLDIGPRGRLTRSPIVIVGGGIAGLSAGWRLLQRGFTDFVVLEMESRAGGNSRWGDTRSRRTHGRHTTSRFPVPRPLASAPSSPIWACSMARRGASARCASGPRSVSTFTDAGRRGSSRRWVLPHATATSSSGSTTGCVRSAPLARSRFPRLLVEACVGSRQRLPGSTRCRWRRGWIRKASTHRTALVGRVRVSRRLRGAVAGRVGVGRRALLRRTASRGERTAHLARRQRLDGPPAARASRPARRVVHDGRAHSRGRRGP